MATGTATPLARQMHYQALHYLRLAVAYNTTGIGTADTVKFNALLPAGAKIFAAMAHVTTAFNAATTNVLTVGTSSGSDADVIAANDVNEGATGTTMVLRGCDLTFSSPTQLYAKYTQTGTAATAGAATLIIYYAPNNDG